MLGKLIARGLKGKTNSYVKKFYPRSYMVYDINTGLGIHTVKVQLLHRQNMKKKPISFQLSLGMSALSF